MQNRTSVHPFPGTAGHIVMGLLPNVDAVRQTLETLRAHGISDDQIGLAMQQVGSDLSLEGGGETFLRPRRTLRRAQSAEVSSADLRASLLRPVSSPFQV